MSEPLGDRISHYRLGVLLGAGGMGAVYRAHDERLGRDIAVKILPAEMMCDEVARARLVREARTASSLNHPHIAQVYDAGEDQSRLFIAMELVEGKTLHDSIPPGGIAAATAVRYGLQIADALAAAHQRGVIHRDLKSTNIMITPEGRVKILDFGLAKRLDEEDAAGTIPDLSLTAAGVVLGTPNHLPPEVLRGQPADARGDVWALGIVLYEMVSGRFPFEGTTMSELTSSIAADKPKPLSGRIPTGIHAVVARCLEKDPAKRYRSGAEAREALERLDETFSPRRGAAPSWTRWAIAALAAVVLVGAAVVFVPRKAALHDRAAGGSLHPKISSLAVLPLVNMSGDPEQEYFADGMTEELITRLASSEALKVTSRTSVMRYKGSKESLKEIAKALGVDAVVEGSVQRAGNRVRVTAQLIEAKSDQHLWAQSFERDFSEVLTLQTEVATDIARQVQATLAPAMGASGPNASAVNPATYELYLKGRYEWTQFTDESVRRAMKYFEKALAIDPKDPRANSGMADAYLLLTQVLAAIPMREGMKQVKEYASRALAADPMSAEAHSSIAAALMFGDWNLRDAEKEVRRSIELNPGYSSSHVVYSVLLTVTGRFEEAIEQDKKAIELDPLSLIAQWNATSALRLTGRFQEALAQSERAEALAPGSLLVVGMRAHIFADMKDFESALKIYDQYLPEQEGGKAEAAAMRAAYEKGGEQGYWQHVIDRTIRMTTPTSETGMAIAYMYAELGDKEKTLRWLEKSCDEHASDMLFINAEPAFHFLRGEPRFKALQRRVGLPSTS